MGFIDNGDGTITTDDGIRIAKPMGMQFPSGGGLRPQEDITRVVSQGGDVMVPGYGEVPEPQRQAMARAFYAQGGAGGGLQISPELAAAAAAGPDLRTAQMAPMGMGGGGGANPLGPPVSVSDALGGLFKGDPEKLRQIQNQNRPAGAPEIPRSQITLPDQDITAEPEGASGGGVVPMDQRVQVGARGGGPGGGGYDAPRVIDKGGMRPVAKTVQEGTKLPEELKAEMADNSISARGANQAALVAKEAENAQTAPLAQTYGQSAEAALAEERAKAQAKDAAMQAALGKLDQMSKQYRETPVNQDAYWKEKGSGARIVSGLAIAMGEFGRALTHGSENVALHIVDKQVNDWMADQSQRRRGAVDDQRSLVGQIQANFQNEAAQRAAMRAQAYDAYRAKLGGIAASSQTDKDRAAAAALDADLKEKSTVEKLKAAQLEADHVTTHEKLVGPTVVGGPKFVKNDGSFLDLPDGTAVKANSPEVAGQVREQLGAVETIKKSSAELRQLLANPSVKNSARVKLLVNDISTSVGAAKMGSARMTGQGELENLQHIFDQNGSVSSDVMGRTREALGALTETAQNAQNRIFQSFPRYSRPTPTASGDLVRFEASDGQGGQQQVPIAFSAVGKGKRKK